MSVDIGRGVGPLSLGGHGENGDQNAQNPATLYRVLHKKALSVRLYKKRRHERFAVRAGRPVTQTTPGFGGLASITGIYTRYYRFGKMQIQNLKFFLTRHLNL